MEGDGDEPIPAGSASWPALACAAGPARADEPAKPDDAAKALAAARTKGLDWLAKNQNADGSWGKTYTVAVTSFACLSYLSASDEPFDGDRGKALVKGLQFLMAQQKDGEFPQQGHTWIHGQGFGTLALSEAYGRSLLCKVKPDMDMNKVKAAVASAVKAIAKNQSTSGGWWYTPGGGDQHEGSTTVCAVQALASANNYGIDIDQKALDKRLRVPEEVAAQGRRLRLQAGRRSQSMKEGSAGGVATLGLMEKFDFQVMVNGYKYLLAIGPAGVSGGNFPEYGCFYGCMGMHLLGEEYKDDKDYHDKTAEFIAAVQKALLRAAGQGRLVAGAGLDGVERPGRAGLRHGLFDADAVRAGSPPEHLQPRAAEAAGEVTNCFVWRRPEGERFAEALPFGSPLNGLFFWTPP